MQSECDLLVIGSGAAGLSAAVTAAHGGLRVIVAEKDAVLGGTTAWSGGWIWAPGNPVCAAAGTSDSAEAAETYLRAVLGTRFDAARVQTFLTHAPRMVAFFQSQTALAFEPGSQIPDTYGHLPGAGTGGRSGPDRCAVAWRGRGGPDPTDGASSGGRRGQRRAGPASWS